MSLQEAINELTEALESDIDYRRSWSANIAMAFKDEYARRDKTVEPNIHQISNTAAEYFLQLLCGNVKVLNKGES